MPNTPLDTLRIEQRQRLTNIKPAERQQQTSAAVERFLCSPEYRGCQHIAAFYPVRHELDLRPLFDACWSDNKKLYLPGLLPQPSKELVFLPFSSSTEMKQNRFQIPEPDLPADKQIDARQLDIVIAPLLAFGPQGQRLGMGGGYYDRTFAFLNQPDKRVKPRLWSIALEIQAQEFTTNPWDVNIHAVVTENEIYRYA